MASKKSSTAGGSKQPRKRKTNGGQVAASHSRQPTSDGSLPTTASGKSAEVVAARTQDGRRSDGGAASRGSCDDREAIYNGRDRGPAHAIARPVDEVAAINGFMIDLDCKLLDQGIVGQSAAGSAASLFDEHVRHWLERDPVLAKAEVRDTGGGLHILLWVESPILIQGGEAREWDRVARGLRNCLPSDPEVNGIIAMTRPVGALNTKYAPPREVRVLREGQPVTRDEVLELSRRVIEQPARLWMRLFFGAERTSPCPLCNKGESLGVAGNWKCQCYECGSVDAAALIYRFFSPDFLASRKESRHG